MKPLTSKEETAAKLREVSKKVPVHEIKTKKELEEFFSKD